MKHGVNQVVADVLGLDIDDVQDDLAQDSADNWDSLNHLRIITAIEQEFEISLTMEEIQGARTVRELNRLVELKTTDP